MLTIPLNAVESYLNSSNMWILTALKGLSSISVISGVTLIPFYYSNVLSNSSANQTHNLVSSHSSIPAEGSKVATSKEQLRQDQLFDLCQKKNTKYLVRDSQGIEREIPELEYQKSQGRVIDVIYPKGQCTREVTPLQ